MRFLTDIRHRWTTLLAAAGTGLVLAAVVFMTLAVARAERERLLERISDEQLGQVVAAADEIEEDLEDIAQDLRYAATVLRAGDTDETRRRIMDALIRSPKAYRAVMICGEREEAPLVVSEPGSPAAASSELRSSMELVARRATGQPGRISLSEPLQDDAGSQYRVFAASSAASGGGDALGWQYAVALLVDTKQYLSRIRILGNQPHLGLLVLGPMNHVTPASSEPLAAAVRDAARGRQHPGLLRALARIRAHEQGTFVLQRGEADLLGMGRFRAVGAFAPVRFIGETYWSITTVRSLRDSEEHVRALIVRGLILGALFTVAAAALVVYVLFSRRRAAELQERLAHADELARLREQAEKTLENIPVGVMSVGDGETVSSMNRALRLRLPDTQVGSQVDQAFPQADPEAVRAVCDLLDKALSTGRAASWLADKLQLFGEEGDYRIVAAPLKAQSGHTQGLLIVEDVTDLRRLQSSLMRAEKLATVGELAAGIAHEIGTPLGVVRGRAEYMLSKREADGPETAGLGIIVEQIDHVARIIRSLLDFARTRPAAVTSVELAPLIERVLELMDYEFKRGKVTLHTDVPDDLPAVAADADQLEQVMVNLLMNALDASDQGGRIEISASVQQAEQTSPAGGLRIEIRDTGCGIPEQIKNRVFDPFFTTKKRGKGTGLGLAIVARLVRDHNARIELENMPERGTRAILLWPTAAAK